MLAIAEGAAILAHRLSDTYECPACGQAVRQTDATCAACGFDLMENLAKKGTPSRAEITDAALAQQAECVMLNKGPFAEEAITFLRQVGLRMDRHQAKKTPRLAPLRAWRDPQGL